MEFIRFLVRHGDGIRGRSDPAMTKIIIVYYQALTDKTTKTSFKGLT